MILPEPNRRLMTYEHRGVWVIVSRLFAGGTQTCTRKKLPDLRVGERCMYFWGGGLMFEPLSSQAEGCCTPQNSASPNAQCLGAEPHLEMRR